MIGILGEELPPRLEAAVGRFIHTISRELTSTIFQIIFIMFKILSKRKDLLRLLSHHSGQTTIRCAAMARLQSTIAGLPFDLQDSSLFQTGAMIGNEWISKSESGKTYNVR